MKSLGQCLAYVKCLINCSNNNTIVVVIIIIIITTNTTSSVAPFLPSSFFLFLFSFPTFFIHFINLS